MPLKSAFTTHIYHVHLGKTLIPDLLDDSYRIQAADNEGLKWSKKNYFAGYTSYGSLSQVHQLSSTFGNLQKKIDRHVLNFAKKLKMDLSKNRMWMDTCWINIMGKGSFHTGHIHPLSFISGTYYVSVPKGASTIKFEDPRANLFMTSPPRPGLNLEISPKAGDLVLFESWLRHEVPANSSSDDRVSVSFNYNWE